MYYIAAMATNLPYIALIWRSESFRFLFSHLLRFITGILARIERAGARIKCDGSTVGGETAENTENV